MDCWFSVGSVDGNQTVNEKDINDLFDGVTDFDVETLNKDEVAELFKLLIECKPISREKRTGLLNDTKPIIEKLHEQICNIGEFYSDEAIENILNNITDLKIESALDQFLEYESDSIRRCSHCGKLMKEGYWLDDEYACSEACRNEIYKRMGAKDDEEAERWYLRDYYMMSDSEIEGMTADEISDYGEAIGYTSGCVMYTSWG